MLLPAGLGAPRHGPAVREGPEDTGVGPGSAQEWGQKWGQGLPGNGARVCLGMGSGSAPQGQGRKTELTFEPKPVSAAKSEAEHLARRNGGWREPWSSSRVQNEAQAAINPPRSSF